MAMPKSVVKFKKGNIEYISNVDAVQYTIKELSRAALRDVAKLVRREMKKRVPVKTGNLKKNIGTWVRKSKDGSARLQLGVYDSKRSKKKGLPPAFYGMFIEFGTSKIKAVPFLRPAVYENLNEIQKIEAKYLSALSGDVKENFDEGEEIEDA
jgi:HK97 gp10 family phage protein